ncbi:transcriptional regulator [Vibrio sp. 10N.286.51.B11]|uniref:helix-turn-helix transcriptional regulator n=1 Tax=Vibrio sp. 10N.286.51.B11 TaxID=3229706 RepID=UPI00354E2A62
MGNKYLQPYEVIVDFIADFHGKDTEVVLHNLDDFEKSIYKIRNGHISGRKVGDPITDLVVKALKINDSTIPFQTNYSAKTPDGKQLKCATFYIRNEAQEIVGALCINSMIDGLLELQSKIDTIVNGMIGNQINHTSDNVDEHLGVTIPEMVDNKITNIIANLNMPTSSLTSDDKINIITELNNDGVFLLKGTIVKVAKMLHMSEPTVYKYLQKIK